MWRLLQAISFSRNMSTVPEHMRFSFYARLTQWQGHNFNLRNLQQNYYPCCCACAVWYDLWVYGLKQSLHIWNRPPTFAYWLYSFYGTAMTIILRYSLWAIGKSPLLNVFSVNPQFCSIHKIRFLILYLYIVFILHKNAVIRRTDFEIFRPNKAMALGMIVLV